MATENTIKSFKDLVVWQKAVDLCVAIYRATRNFPADERFGLTSDSELRKTSRSIPYNIAEGHMRPTTADYLRFIGIAQGSGGELETQIVLAERLGYFSPDESSALLRSYCEVERMLAGLTRSLEQR